MRRLRLKGKQLPLVQLHAPHTQESFFCLFVFFSFLWLMFEARSWNHPQKQYHKIWHGEGIHRTQSGYIIRKISFEKYHHSFTLETQFIY